jgi:hypothetical protein
LFLGEDLLVIHRSRFRVGLVLVCSAVFSVAAGLGAGQSQAAPLQQEAAREKPPHPQPADISGDWEVAWTGRLGTEPGALHLQQDGTKLSGAFKDVHGLSSVSGTVTENRISFDVQFQGPRPFTTRFTGNASGGEIEGTSEAIGVTDGGAYLGHGGEIVHPEHPWKAMRVAHRPSPSGQTGSSQSWSNQQSNQSGSKSGSSPNSPPKN